MIRALHFENLALSSGGLADESLLNPARHGKAAAVARQTERRHAGERDLIEWKLVELVCLGFL